MKLGRLRQIEEQAPDINLIPIMNLFVGMIPLLLMCAAFYTVGVVNATVPMLGEDGESDIAAEETKVTLTVEVRRDRSYHVTLQSDLLAEGELDRYEMSFPGKGTHLDTKALGDYAWEIKQKYPRSDTAILVPELEVFYEDLVKTMDTVRERIGESSSGDPERIILFPAIVVSTIHTGPPEGLQPDPEVEGDGAQPGGEQGAGGGGAD